MEMIDVGSNIKLKPADKVVGGLIALVGLALFGFIGVTVLPFLILAAKNTIYFVAELVALVLIGMVALDKGFWRSIFYGWKNISRKIRKAVVSSDPIGTIDTVINRFESKLEDIDTQMNASAAAIKKHNATIKMADQQRESELNLARADQTELGRQQHALAASRWEDMVNELTPMSTTLASVQAALIKAREMCVSKIADLKSQRKVLSIKLDVYTSSSNVVRSVKRFFSNSPELEMLEMAVDNIEETSYLAEAELDSFMRVMGPQLAAQDTKASAEALNAMARFEKFLLAPPAPKVPILLDAAKPAAVKA